MGMGQYLWYRFLGCVDPFASDFAVNRTGFDPSQQLRLRWFQCQTSRRCAKPPKQLREFFQEPVHWGLVW